MVALAYLFPVISVIILKTVLHFNGEWTVLLWIFIWGELTIAFLHISAILFQSLKTEYLGSVVTSVHFEDEWIELIETIQNKKDHNGIYHPVKVVNERYHPVKYYFYTTRNSKIKTTLQFYQHVLSIWKTSPKKIYWTGSKIKGGRREGETCSLSELSINDEKDNAKWVSITEKHKYLNPIQNSNSIFRFQKLLIKKPEN